MPLAIRLTRLLSEHSRSAIQQLNTLDISIMYNFLLTSRSNHVFLPLTKTGIIKQESPTTTTTTTTTTQPKQCNNNNQPQQKKSTLLKLSLNLITYIICRLRIFLRSDSSSNSPRLL